jgi:dihydrolipoamide dehydrogenase
MNEDLDVIIIGAGTAGLSALNQVRKHTSRFVIINDEPWGSVCARVGCMPSKVLIEAANAFHRRTSFAEFGITGAAQLAVDLPAVFRRIRHLRDEFVAGVLKLTADLGEQAISGRARLIGPDRVTVDGRELRARRIILATGSSPVVPAPWRALGERVLSSDALFEQIDLPKRIAVVGLGAIGVEIAQALSRLGVDVTGFDGLQSIAGVSDPAVNRVAIELLAREFPIHLGSNVELSEIGGGVRVRAGDVEVTVDKVIAAIGRRPNIDEIGLESLGIELDERGLPAVNPVTQQIDELPVYLVGDANGYAPLQHEASDEGYIAGLNAGSPKPTRIERRTPLAIVFADPNIAAVGQRFEALAGTSFITGSVDFAHQGRARAAQRNRGLLRIYASCDAGLLLGAEMCAPGGEHFAHLLALAVQRGLTVDELLRLPFYHPVLEEGVRTALRDLASQLAASVRSDLASCEAHGVEALD